VKYKVYNHSKSINFLTNLKRNHFRAACFHTKLHFTASQKATTRGKNSNNRLKGNGDLKKELKNADLVRTNNRVVHISEEQDPESLVEISGYIQSGQ